MNGVGRRRWCRQVGLTALAALLTVAIGSPVRADLPAAAPSVPAPGLARIWIYRLYEPYVSLARPYIRLNGAVVGISEPGGAFYRDVAPGTYAVTVDSTGIDTNQFATVGVGPGQQVFVKILDDPSWNSGGGGGEQGGGGGGWARDTFYTWLIQPQAAAAEISRLPLYNGG
jgi:hypothetical protein